MGYFQENRKKVLMLTVALVALTAGVLLIVWHFYPHGNTSGLHAQVYYYDVGSKKLFIVPATELPPIPGPSGQKLADGSPGGVRAYVYSCGDCGNEKDQTIMYLEMFTPDAREKRIALTKKFGSISSQLAPNSRMPRSVREQVGIEDLNAGRMLASPGKPNEWVEATSPEGMALLAASLKCDSGKPAEQCWPR